MVVSGCFLMEIGCLGGKKAVWCGIWQVWGGLGCFGVVWGVSTDPFLLNRTDA